MNRGTFALALILFAGFALPCRADVNPEDQAAALTLFKEGRALMASGQYAEACPKFAGSQKLDPGVGTVLNLAYCYERLGRTASAWSAYGTAAVAAHDKGQTERETIARTHAAELERSLVRVTIAVTASTSIPETDSADGAVDVKLDGASIPKNLWGTAMAVDPGHHEVRAAAAGRMPWSSSFDADTAHPATTVTVPVLAIESAPPVPPPPAAASVAPPSARDPQPWRTASFVAGGVGIVALGVGAAFALAAKSQFDDSQSPDECQAGRCNPAGQAAQSRAFTNADVATAAMSAGAVALAGAAILWFAAPRNVSQTRGVRVEPAVGKDTWTLNASGVW